MDAFLLSILRNKKEEAQSFFFIKNLVILKAFQMNLAQASSPLANIVLFIVKFFMAIRALDLPFTVCSKEQSLFCRMYVLSTEDRLRVGSKTVTKVVLSDVSLLMYES